MKAMGTYLFLRKQRKVKKTIMAQSIQNINEIQYTCINEFNFLPLKVTTILLLKDKQNGRRSKQKEEISNIIPQSWLTFLPNNP